MIIETLVNFKLRNGKGTMLAGRYNDREKPFPDEIYEEIDSNKQGKRHTLRILDDTPSSAVSKSTKKQPQEEHEDMNTMDEEEDIVDTKEKKRPRKKRKKS